jgi:hypothetical protein
MNKQICFVLISILSFFLLFFTPENGRNKKVKNIAKRESDYNQELNLPSANTNIKGKVKKDIIIQIAKRYSTVLWGEVSMGIAIPQADLHGDILAYEISFSTKHKEFPIYGEIIKSVRRGRVLVGESYITGDKKLYNSGRKLKWGVDSYGTMVISARYDMYPIPEYTNGLSKFYTTGDMAKQKAAAILKTDKIKMTKMYYAGALSRWFEFTAHDGRRILIDIYSLKAYLSNEIIGKNPIENRKKIEFAKSRNRKAWEEIKDELCSKSNRGVKEIRTYLIENVPFYDYSFGRSPTAVAMILGYYNDKGYHKLIDYYFDRWDPIEEEWDMEVPNVQRELAEAMKINNEGGTHPDNVVPGITYVTNNINGYRFSINRSCRAAFSNDFLWELITGEINEGRPFFWNIYDSWSYERGIIDDRSVAAVGYTSTHMVIVHSTEDAQEHYWDYTISPGGPLHHIWIISIIPTGNRPPILNPIGNKSIREGEELCFVIEGNDPDDDSLTYSVQNLPEGAAFNKTTRTFSWAPNYTQSGNYTVRFGISDGEYSDFEDVEITVVNVKNIKPKP